MILRVPAIFGSEADRERYRAACAVQLREQAARGIRFAVGPAPVTVTAPSGRIFHAAEPITASDLLGGTEPGWCALERHIREGRVLEADRVTEGT